MKEKKDIDLKTKIGKGYCLICKKSVSFISEVLSCKHGNKSLQDKHIYK